MDDVSRILKDIDKNNEKTFHLLYCSADKVDVKKFHESCDGKGPTLTVLYGKYNTIFGGFTSQDWCSGNMMTKRDEKAFLFYKNDHPEAECIFLPIKTGDADRAITCDANFGPTFGGGAYFWNDYDLQTFKKDVSPESESKDGYIKLNGTVNFGYAYETSDLKEKEINAGKLLLKRIEIYQVVDGILTDPWRRKPTDEEMDEMKRRLEEMKPVLGLGIKTYNILLVGTIGSGKSSFYNTLATVFTGAIKLRAQARNAPTSVTNEFHAYELKSGKEDGKPLNLRIFDIRGFEANRGYEHEFDPILDGKLRIGYEFPDKAGPVPQSKLKDVSLKDKIHLVCFVTGTSNLDILTPELQEQIKRLQKSINKKGLPMVVVATKYDDLCLKISEDADRVYRSPKARDATKTVSTFFGIPEKHVFPIINYVNDEVINSGKNRLALQALNAMVELSRDNLEKQNDSFLSDPWRKRPTDEEMDEMKRRLEEMKPVPGLGIKTYNILLVGLIGSGKSSFYNTLATVFTGAIKLHAQARNAPTSVTNELHAYELKSGKEDERPLNLRIFDIRGFETNRGYEHEFDPLLDGKLRIGYEFPDQAVPVPQNKLKDESLKDKIHLVCFVTGASNLDKLTPELQEQIKRLQKSINKKGLPMVVVATKYDDLCLMISEDADRVYRSPKARDATKTVSTIFGILEKHVFPIINYVNDEVMNSGKNRLALQALNAMVELSRDYLEKHNDGFLSEQWRKRPTNEEMFEMKKRIEKMKPVPGLGIKTYNILLLGVIGSGKSSFYNTLATVFMGAVKSHAPAMDALTSVTNEVHAYELKSKNGKPLNLRIFDIRGFEANRGYEHEFDLLLNGKLPIGYSFPEQPVPVRQDELRTASLKNEIHLVCFVTGTSNLDSLTPELQGRIRSLQESINKKGLPMAVVATKFDDICEQISEDADAVYRSPIARDDTKKVSAFFGIQEKFTFPIVNYVNDEVVKDGKDRLALHALNSMVDMIRDSLEKHTELSCKLDSWSKRASKLHIPRHSNEKEIVLMKIGAELIEIGDKGLRVLCVGPVHCGKSSFIDSVSSLLRDEIQCKATGGYARSMKSQGGHSISTTERFNMYQMKYRNESGDIVNSKAYFGDIPGFQEHGGIQLEDIKQVILGHVPNKYKFKYGMRRDSSKFKRKPQKKDKVHCVCFVFDVSTSPDKLSEKLQNTLKSLQVLLLDKEIPYIVVLTKGDLLSDMENESKIHVFESTNLKENKDMLIRMFQFKENRMFPVINYVHEDTVVPDIDALLIPVVQEILKVGKEYLEDFSDDPSDESDD